MSAVQDIEKAHTEFKRLLAEKSAEVTGMVNSWTDETGKGQFKLEPQEHAKYVKAVNEAKDLKERVAATEVEMGILDYLDAPAGTTAAGEDQGRSQRGAQVKSLSQEVLTSEIWQEMKASGYERVGSRMKIERGVPNLALAGKDVYSAMGGEISIPSLGQAQNLGWTERTLRPGRVRDLFPAESTSAAMLYGVRETGYTNRAGVVPERTSSSGGPATGGSTDIYGLKPKSELTIVPVTYPIATVAHIMYVHKQTLDDEPRIRGILDRDMIDGVKMAEDEQILWGDGVGDNLTGLMNTDGIQAYPGENEKRSAQIRRAATRAILAYFQPTGVVLHPFDWEAIELETDLNGAYTVAVSVAVGGEKRVWRLSVTDSPAMRQGDALVGAFGTGAKLYDREQVNVQVSTENRDLFERNAYTLRAEERIGLVVDRPESFVHLSLTDPT